MSSEDTHPEIPVVCAECGTRSRVPFPEVDDAVERHNERRHDGEASARVDPDVFDELAEFVARDEGLLD